MSRLAALPRIPLGTLPTPLEQAPNLSRHLGINLLLKRDDLTGFALGGNKVRKLEFLLADAVERGADILVTGGGPQSNHARTTAAAARKAGMDAKLVFFGRPPSAINGNLLLDQLLGADYVYAQTEDKNETDRIVEKTVRDLEKQGRKPYLIPVGGSTALGCASYVLAVGELLEQLDEQGIKPDYIFITTGSCGTHAGILSGLAYYGAHIPVYGISVSRSRQECLERIPKLVQKTAELLDHTLDVKPEDINVNERYLGPAYAIPTPEGNAAIRTTARMEGVFLDPVYTGKTMAGLIDLTHRGEIPQGSTVVFWHTGGIPGLFGLADSFQNE